MSLKERAKKIKILLMDVDGVLTDGRLYYTEEGEMIKVFNVHDGLGIKRIQKEGIKTGVISGRESQALRSRLEELGIEEIFMGKLKKDGILDEITRRLGLTYDEVAFVGDDLVDVPVLKRVGFPICVRNSPDEVRKVCLYETMQKGGDGAIREVVDLIIELRRR